MKFNRLTGAIRIESSKNNIADKKLYQAKLMVKISCSLIYVLTKNILS